MSKIIKTTKKEVVKIMNYGLQIGTKFNYDGTPKKYPGNTVIADVRADSPACSVIHHLHQLLSKCGAGSCFIFLPEDSYHVTLIRGVNDYVRDPAYWPSALEADMPMAGVDRYFEERVRSVEFPLDIRMKFQQVQIDGHDVRICLTPWDDEEDRRLRQFRDEVAAAVGLRLPGHDTYTYHVTLAYVLNIPEGEVLRQQQAALEEMNRFLENQDGFYLSAPRIAFYNDMMNFHSERIPRT